MNKSAKYLSTALILAPALAIGQLIVQPDPNQGIQFQDTRVDEQSSAVVTLTSNPVNDVMQDVNLSLQNGQVFSIDNNFFRLEPMQQAQVRVTFAPREAGDYNDVLIILAGAPMGRVYRYDLRLTGRGVGGNQEEPDIEVEADEILLFIDDPDGHDEDSFSIENQGDADLEFEILVPEVAWLEVDPIDGVVEPDDAVDIVVGTAAIPEEEGEYEAELVILSNDPDEDEISVTVILSVDFADEASIVVEPEWILFEVRDPEQRPRDFGIISNIGDEVLEYQIDFWDVDQRWLGVDPMEGTVDPDTSVFLLVFITEDIPEENGEYGGGFNIWSNDPDNQVVGVEVILTVNIQEELTISLARGWNLISSSFDFSEDYIDEEGPDFGLIFADIQDSIISIEDLEGNFCHPPANLWNIPAWNTDQGYLVKATAEVDLIISGEEIPEERPIQLRQGWNMFSYYPAGPMPVTEAFRELLDNERVIMVKNGDGEFHHPNRFWNDFDMQPGQGYMALAAEDCELVYVDVEAASQPKPERDYRPRTAQLQHFPEPVNTGRNMSVLLHSLFISDVDDFNGAEIGCTSGDGIWGGAMVLEEEFPWAMPLWEDDRWSQDLDGLEEGVPLHFYYWDANIGEVELDVEVAEGGELEYHRDGFLRLRLSALSAPDDGIQPQEYGITSVYPNPFNQSASVAFTLPHASDLSLTLHDRQGRFIAILASGFHSAGAHQQSFSVPRLSSGTYLLRLEAGGVRSVENIVLLK